MHIDVPAFLSSLKIMVEGWLGIFAVMAVIIVVIKLLGRATAEKKDT
ncbi:MAG: OadG-related small transporter subunit [Clostridia bacterium]|nr:OadG-related small transporter subunit [Clostridia bacterium]